MFPFAVSAVLQDGSRRTLYTVAPSWADAHDRMRASLPAEPVWCSARPIGRAQRSPHLASTLHGADWQQADTVILDDEPAQAAAAFPDPVVEPASRALMIGVWLSVAALGAFTAFGLARLVLWAIATLPAV